MRRAVGAVVVAVAVVAPAGASASAQATAPTGQELSLQAEATALTAQLAAQQVTLDQLAERYDASRIHLAGLQAAVDAGARTLAATRRSLAAAATILRAQALAGYVSGSQTPLLAAPGQAGADPSLTVGYAEVTASVEHRAMLAYAELGRAQRAEQAVVVARRDAARVGLATVADAERQARAASTIEAATLARVTGRLGVLVTADQRHRQALEAAAIRDAATATTSTAAASAPGTTVAPTTAATVGTTPPVGAPVPTTTSPPTTTRVVAPVPPTTARLQAPTTTAGPTTTTTVAATTTTVAAPAPPIAPPASGASAAIAYAQAQLGKPYQWGGSGPASFDCSGLVMRAWEAGGVSFPHLAQSQYDETTRVPIADLEPGDIVFFGTPGDVYHDGLYVGGGNMIDAPSTGQVVRVESIYWSSLLGGGRVG